MRPTSGKQNETVLLSQENETELNVRAKSHREGAGGAVPDGEEPDEEQERAAPVERHQKPVVRPEVLLQHTRTRCQGSSRNRKQPVRDCFVLTETFWEVVTSNMIIPNPKKPQYAETMSSVIEKSITDETAPKIPVNTLL